jgi:hypothetical protein
VNVQLSIDAGTFKGMRYEGSLDRCPSYFLLNEHRIDCSTDEKAENVRGMIYSFLSVFRYITYYDTSIGSVSISRVDNAELDR